MLTGKILDATGNWSVALFLPIALAQLFGAWRPRGDDAPRGADSLQHLKDRVAEVSKGMECGIALDGFEGFEPGDILHCYVQREERRTSLDQPI